MYPITNAVKALFDAEQRKVLRITGGPNFRGTKTVGPSNVVSVDDAIATPASDVTIGIEPVQDLQGYDYPWPAGGGKNLFDLKGFLDDREAEYTVSNDDYIITTKSSLFTQLYVFSDSDIQITISASAYENITTTNARIDLLNSSGNVVANFYASSRPVTITASKLRFNWTQSGEFKVSKLQIEKGTIATPYPLQLK